MNNGKVYIGQTISSLKQRRCQHISDANTRGQNSCFYNALKKYGVDNFVWTVMNECYDIETLNRLEKYYIEYYESMNREFGYNRTSGGLNYIVSKKTREKMSIAKQEMSEEARNIWRNKLSNRVVSIKIKQKMSDNHADFSGEKNPMYGVDRSGKNGTFYGRKHTSESIEKMRVAGRNISDETREKMRQAALNRTDETKNKMSEAKKGKKNPNFGNYGKRNKK